jgi:hypothetical protein
MNVPSHPDARALREPRAALRARGLRPKVFWVPDMRTPDAIARMHRESELLAASADEADSQAFIDSLADWDTPSHREDSGR